jgi:hypothetical protein
VIDVIYGILAGKWKTEKPAKEYVMNAIKKIYRRRERIRHVNHRARHSTIGNRICYGRAGYSGGIRYAGQWVGVHF